VPERYQPEQFAAYLAKETREWGEIVRASGVKVE
jgi:tripartite-type tricarboxylate transporter receptor subunit TctC